MKWGEGGDLGPGGHRKRGALLEEGRGERRWDGGGAGTKVERPQQCVGGVGLCKGLARYTFVSLNVTSPSLVLPFTLLLYLLKVIPCSASSYVHSTPLLREVS